MLRLPLTYTILALIATGANIARQDITTRLYQGAYTFTLSILIDDDIGILIKRIAYKKFIFQRNPIKIKQHIRFFFKQGAPLCN